MLARHWATMDGRINTDVASISHRLGRPLNNTSDTDALTDHRYRLYAPVLESIKIAIDLGIGHIGMVISWPLVCHITAWLSNDPNEVSNQNWHPAIFSAIIMPNNKLCSEKVAMKKQKRYPGMFVLASLLLLSACGPGLPGPVTPTPVPPPTLTSTALPLSEEDYQVKAWVDSEQPKVTQSQTVYGKILKGDQPVTGARMYSVVHYANLDKRYPQTGFEMTGKNGIASVSFPVLDVGAETDVTVDVYLFYEQLAFHHTVLFMPRC